MKLAVIVQYLLVFCALVMPIGKDTSAAENPNLTGRIVDAETGKPLSGASIVIEGTNRGTSTVDNGGYQMFSLPQGSFNIIASMIGYKPVAKEVEITVEQTNTVDFKLTESPLELPSVVITATRTPRFIKNMPVRTEVITRKAIETKAADNLYEALNGSPGIRIEQQCQACNFSVLRMQGLGADHTQVLLDGQPVYSGLASVYGLQQLSTAEIHQIEIVKGAGSALYGSNAIAGAINIITAKPRKTEATVGIKVGEYGTNNYQFSAATRQNNLGLFVFAQQDLGNAIDVSSDGIGSDQVKEPDGITDRVKTDAKNLGFNLFIDDVIATDELSIRGRWLSEIRQGGELNDGIYENPFTAGTERIATDRYSVTIGYSRQFSTENEINLNLSTGQHKRNATNDTFLGDYEETHGTLPPVDILRPYIAKEDLNVFTLNYMHPMGTHRFLTGFQYSHNALDETGKYVDSKTGTAYTSYSDKEADDFGIYIQDEFAVSKRFELVSGLRFDLHQSEDNFRGSGNVHPDGVEPIKYDESIVNPRFALKYNATNELTLRGSVGTGFRVPYGFSEDLHLCSGSPRVYKGSNLKPEKSISMSANADYRTHRLGLNLNIYLTELKDAIGFTDANLAARQLGYDYQWKNINDAFVMGLEIGAQYAFTRDLMTRVNVEFNSAEYENRRADWKGTTFYDNSKYLSRYPVTSGGFKIDYSPSSWNLTLDGDYTSRMYIDYWSEDNPTESKIHKTESFVLLNTQVSKVFFSNFKMFLGVNNLTDYIQEEKHTDDAAFMYAPMYGRIFYGGTRITIL